MTHRIFFWVQHLLGIGHLKRAATLTRAFRRAGMDVTLVSGGDEVADLDLAGARFVQLPPVRASGRSFRILLDRTGREIDDAFRAARRDLLIRAWRDCSPHAIVTELFPFGRRQLRHELLPLLEAARTEPGRTLIVSSVRDILVEPPRPERAAEMLDRARTLYDRVLVHGDPAFVSFGETFAHASQIADRVFHTGYVVDAPMPAPGGPGEGEVIVSAGGGAVGETLFRAAIAARPQTRLAGRTWRILAGPALAGDRFSALAGEAPDGVIVERARPDFGTLIANCALSISQGGYNTVMEILAAGTRSVVVPYAGGLETEQTLRTRLLENRNGIRAIAEDGLGAAGLAAAIDAALDAPPPDATGIDMNGAEASARLIGEWLA